jgi:hypothetical protein
MYETFIEKVKEALGGEPSLYDTARRGYQYGTHGEPAVWIKWHTGGAHGASCWDDSPANRIVSGESQPEFEEFDKILEAICPSITFLQYKGISREVIKSDDYSDSDYYGNSDTYSLKYVLMKDLYNALNSRNLGDW